MKFSIVTPVYNGEQYLTETIESVLSQEGNFEIEYIIQDGKSTDQTIEVVKKYQTLLQNKQYQLKCRGVSLVWHSEKDHGMYDAVNKGFARATGEIFAYINSDDYYLPGAFEIITRTFTKFPNINWVKGVTSIKRDSAYPAPNKCFLYNQAWITRGVYGRNAYFIHQDSVFWKRDLWEKTGGVNSNLRYAGDYDLWIRFAHHAPLWSLNVPISVFREREGQLSEDMTLYRAEQQKIAIEQGVFVKFIKLYFWLYSLSSLIKPLISWIYPLVFWRRNRYYIEVNKQKEPFIKTAWTFFS